MLSCYGSTTELPANSRQSIRSGATKWCSKRRVVLSLLSYSTSLITSTCPSCWVRPKTSRISIRDDSLLKKQSNQVAQQLNLKTEQENLDYNVGPKAMEDYKLWTPATGFGTGYSADVNPSISNDFTAGAFRITHSSIQGYLTLE